MCIRDREGKLRHYGVSVEKVEEALKAIEYPGVQTVQIIYNIFRQRPADLLFQETQRRGVGILARVPLSSGLLTGKTVSYTHLDVYKRQPVSNAAPIEPLRLNDAEWKKRLTPAQYDVLGHEGTERAQSSALNHETRAGTYHCAGCDLPLFSSASKFDSGTGWPSFFTALPGAIATKIDFKLVLPRTEYHLSLIHI